TPGGGVRVSIDAGQSWPAAIEGLTNSVVRTLGLEPETGRLWAGTSGGGVFVSNDAGQSWQAAGIGARLNLLLSLANLPFWYHGLNPDWELLPNVTVRQLSIPVGSAFTYRPMSNNELEMVAMWGMTVGRTRLDLDTYQSLSWRIGLFIRGLTQLVRDNLSNLTIGLAGLAVLGYSWAYVRWGQRYKISLGRFILVFPWRSHTLPDLVRAELDQVYPSWHKQVKKLLLWWGEVIPRDLQAVPIPYRRWALQTYLTEHQTSQPIEFHQDQLRLLAGKHPRSWLETWGNITKEIRQAPGLSNLARQNVDQLAHTLADALDFELGEVRSWPAAQAYSVKAPLLRVNVPPIFPLIFIAEPQPDEESVRRLVDYVNSLREGGYFALIVPLEPARPIVDIPAQLRLRLQATPQVNDFIILSSDQVLDILTAREPNAYLVTQILSQVDLTTISPFQDSGPCPPNMFFGREFEIKQIVEGIGRGDFAVVGNRKAGKTSLLQRLNTNLVTHPRFLPWLINCQIVNDADSFYSEFEVESDLTLDNYTPEAFEKLMRTLVTLEAKPVFLLDEVDALLYSEGQTGERLVGVWRKLAQDGVCHFVFVGTDTLARKLRNPHSIFFNFPQRIDLKYLEPDVARRVIKEPIATLGLKLEPEEDMITRIVDLSSGHPNLLQTIGKRLVTQASNHRQRTLTLDACEAIAQDDDFNQFYLELVWGVTSPLEKLVTLLAPLNPFTVSDIENSLQQLDISFDPDDLDEALDLLEVYAILKRKNRYYSFNPHYFQEILHRTQDVQRLANSEKRKLIQE
ncbi:MAG: AAA family ATPase, partial [Chloroflexota bacterium]